MMPFNLSFRRLLLKYFPQLTNEDLNRHESLFALRYQLIHELNYVSPEESPDESGAQGSEKAVQDPKERYKLTELSFECLKLYKSLKPVIPKLADLKNKGFATRAEFIEALSKIGDTQIDQHKSLILKYAQNDIERVTREAEKVFQDKKISKKDFDKIHNLWIKRRQFALEQGYFFQFPLTNFFSYFKRLVEFRLAQIGALNIFLQNHLTFLIIAIVTLLLLLFLGILVGLSQPKLKSTLSDLQKEITVVKNEDQRQEIVKRLEKYYLNISLPDSVKLHVKAEVDSMLKQRQPGELLEITENELQGNVYALENHLNKILEGALIATAQSDEATYQRLIRHCKTLASVVDEETDNNYWQPWVASVADFDSTQVWAWLLANQAERLCSRYHQDQKHYELSEQYGSYGLKLLKQVKDERLRLDIMQRLLTILYQTRGMYDLFYPIAKKESSRADSIKYHLRAVGIAYHHANALSFAGYNNEALKAFDEVVQKTRLYGEIPWIEWYEAQGLLGVARSNRDVGNYEKARSICKKIAKLSLDNWQRIQLHNTQGVVYRNLSYYSEAKDEYNTALNLAERAEIKGDEILALNNLGYLYYLLTDFNRADDFIRRARELFEDSKLQDVELKSVILLNFSEILADLNKREQFDKTVEQANDLIKSISLPNKKAQFLSSLGRFNMKAGNFQQASQYFRQAVELYEAYGLVRVALDTRADFIQCLISLNDFAEANEVAENLYRTALANHDELAEIEGIGLLARIAYKQGQLDYAIRGSNRLIRRVEKLSEKISDDDLLTVFRQKSYAYLHEAVNYELERGNIDSAFIKLDYIKGRVLKKGLSALGNAYLLNIDTLKERLKEKQLLINYFVTNNTVYAFVLDSQNLRLYEKQVDLDDLTKLANEFILSIEKSLAVFEEPYSVLYDQHYEKTSALSSKLFQDLLGWPELISQLEETEITYIVPDNILYKIPFSCLKTSTGKDSSFLLRQTATINLPSAVFIKPLPTRREEVYRKKVLMSINHNFPKADELENAIKRLFQNTNQLVIDKPEIHKEDVLSALNQGYNIYIFLGHSEANSINPDLSTFELTAIRQSDFSDHTIEVSLADLKSVDWSRAETVFLIGCETAKGPLYSGTGLGGLQQGLLTLGAREVLASDWKIDAIHAIPQTIEFLKSWGRSSYSALTLRDVQARTIQDLQNHSYYKWPHPYIWASFILSQTALN